MNGLSKGHRLSCVAPSEMRSSSISVSGAVRAETGGGSILECTGIKACLGYVGMDVGGSPRPGDGGGGCWGCAMGAVLTGMDGIGVGEAVDECTL